MTVPNWKIERYLLEELPESEMIALKTLENQSAEFKANLELLKNSNEELLAKYPAKNIACKVHSNFRKFTEICAMPLRIAAVLLICSATLLMVFIWQENIVVVSEDGIRVKGLKTDLEIWRKTGDSIERLTDKSIAKAGDLLQIRYIAEKESYGVLLSIDGSGTLTVHLAGKQGKAAKLEVGKIVSLEKAYELDNAPKFETFYLFTDNKEFTLAPIAESLLQGNLPKGLQVAVLTLLKK
jgi:hypothetical protein